MSAPALIDRASDSGEAATGIGTWCGELELSGDGQPRAVVSSGAEQPFARIQTPDQFAALRDAFLHAPYWEVVVQRGGTYLLRLDPTLHAVALR